MPDSDRGNGSQALVAQEGGNSEGGEQAAEGDQQASGQGANAPVVVQPPASPIEADEGQGQAYTEQGEPYQLRDLIAQEDMAYWAMWMFFAALATFIITTAGTFLIWRQVTLTKEAVKDTGEATKAMLEANAISKDAAVRELRAYVCVNNILVEPLKEGSPPVYTIAFENVGLTPARNVRLQVWHKLTFGPESSAKFAKAPQNRRRHSDLFPNVESNLTSTAAEGPTNDLIEAIMASKATLVFGGVISYSDVFKKRRRTTFRAYIHRDSIGKDGTIRLAISEKGNHST
ncbi:MAG: hypothetical protein AAFW97_15660, partial [Pseudomonadota bacterium]